MAVRKRKWFWDTAGSQIAFHLYSSLSFDSDLIILDKKD